MAKPLPGLDSELKARLKARAAAAAAASSSSGGQQDAAPVRSQTDRHSKRQDMMLGSSEGASSFLDESSSGDKKPRMRRRDKLLALAQGKNETAPSRRSAYSSAQRASTRVGSSSAGDLASSAANRLAELIAMIGERGSYAQLEVAAALMENPALVAKATPEGHTLLMAVVSIGDFEWALALLGAGAPADAKTKTNQTILHFLVEHRIVEAAATELATQIIDHALAHGLKPSDVTSDGTSVLLHALIHSPNTEGHLVPVLLERGYDINLANYAGISCLYVALANNYVDLAQYFVDNGAGVSNKTSEGVTILDIAFQTLGEAHPLYYTIFMKVEEKRVKEAGNIIAEIVQTESDYCRDLEVVLEHYAKGLVADMHISDVTRKALFWNLVDVLPGNVEALARLRDTVALPPDEQRVAQALLPLIPHLRSVYIPYVGNQNTAIETLRLIGASCPGLSAWLLNRKNVPEVRNQAIDSYLIKPLQRITRYPLLIRELQKHIPSYHVDYDDLQKLSAQLAEVLTESNDFKRVCDQKLYAKMWFRNLGVRLPHNAQLEQTGTCLCTRTGHKGKPAELSYYAFTECLVLIEGPGPTGETQTPQSLECLWDALYYEHIAVWDSDDPVNKPNRCLIVRRDRRDRNVTAEFDSVAAREAFQSFLSAKVASLVRHATPLDELSPGDLLAPLENEVFQAGFFDPADQEMLWYDNAVKHASIEDVPPLLDSPDGSWSADPLTALLHAFMSEEHHHQRDLQVVLNIGIAAPLQAKTLPDAEGRYLSGELPILLGAHLRMDDGLREAWKAAYPPEQTQTQTQTAACPYGAASEDVAVAFLQHFDVYLSNQALVQHCSELPLAAARLLHLKQVSSQLAAHLQSFHACLDRTVIRRDHTDLSLQAFLSLPLTRLHKQEQWAAQLQQLATQPKLQAAVKRAQTKIADLLSEIQRRSPFSERFASLVSLQESITGAFRIPLATRGRVLIQTGYVTASESTKPDLAKKTCRLYLFDDIFLLASPSSNNSNESKLRFWSTLSDVKLIEEETLFRLESAPTYSGKPFKLQLVSQAERGSQNSAAEWSRSFRKIIKEFQKKKLQRVEKPRKEEDASVKDIKKAQALASIGGGTRRPGLGDASVTGELGGRRVTDLKSLKAMAVAAQSSPASSSCPEAEFPSPTSATPPKPPGLPPLPAADQTTPAAAPPVRPPRAAFAPLVKTGSGIHMVPTRPPPTSATPSLTPSDGALPNRQSPALPSRTPGVSLSPSDGVLPSRQSPALPSRTLGVALSPSDGAAPSSPVRSPRALPALPPPSQAGDQRTVSPVPRRLPPPPASRADSPGPASPSTPPRKPPRPQP